MRLQIIDRDALAAAGDDEPDIDPAENEADTADDSDTAVAGKRREWVLAVEGYPTGDGRMYAAGSFTWRELPLPFMATDVTGMGHDGAKLVANLVSITRDGSEIKGITEDIDSDDEDVLRLQRLMDDKDLRGVSVDMDNLAGEMIFAMAEPEDEVVTEDGSSEMRIPIGGDSERMEFTAARIIGATALPFPAFAEAHQSIAASGIFEGHATACVVPSLTAAATSDDVTLVREALGDNEPALEAFDRIVAMAEIEDEEAPTPEVDDEEVAALVASIEPPTTPPLAFFQKPEGQCSTQTVTDDGRVTGRLATWDQCHIGYSNECVLAPRSLADYAAFLTGELVTAEGTRVRVGQITVDAGHASTTLAAGPAKQHYDHTGWVAADVVIGEDDDGIWYSGAVRPNLDELSMRKFMAADVSGDWRRINGDMELVAIASVNVPGFPKMETMVAGGQVQTLLLTPACGCDDEYAATRDRIAASIGRHPTQLQAARDEVARRIGRSHKERRAALVRRRFGF